MKRLSLREAWPYLKDLQQDPLAVLLEWFHAHPRLVHDQAQRAAGPAKQQPAVRPAPLPQNDERVVLEAFALRQRPPQARAFHGTIATTHQGSTPRARPWRIPPTTHKPNRT
ncbi:hypothetical protein, partial [Thermus scotoductus]|uniref:hypothetical protein n=1 Tax=Thermus scotoductus TaxID=37636 RepID=UPI001000127E